MCEGRTELSEVEASARGGGEAGAGGEWGVTGWFLQPAGGVGAQPITGLLVTSQLRGRAIPTESQKKVQVEARTQNKAGAVWILWFYRQDDFDFSDFYNQRGEFYPLKQPD